MAVPNPKAAIDDNQYKYLTNMSAGKTPTGSAANTGQQSWAKSQLANSSYTPVPNPNPATPSVKTKPVTSTPNTIPTPKSSGVNAPTKTVNTNVPNPNNVQQPTTDASQYVNWQTKQNENYANLEKLMNSQFNYDPETDPAYQAQRQLAQLRAGDATKSAMEAANEKGVFGSSLMTSQMGQIQQRAEQEAAAYIPEYRQQAYGQYQDRLANAGILLNQSSDLRRQGFDESAKEADLTGYYKPQGADQLISQLMSLKGQAETSGISVADRNALSSQADQIRSQLQAMGMDTSALGANVSRANAATSNIGTRTLAGRTQDYNESADTRDFNYGVTRDDVVDQQWNKEFEYTQGRDKVADQQWQDEFDRIKEQDGIQNALAWASHNLNVQQENRIGSKQSSGSSSSGSSGGSSKTGTIEDINMPRTSASMETYIINNLPGGKNVFGPPSPQQDELIESMILSNPNLSEKDRIKLYNRFGLPLPE